MGTDLAAARVRLGAAVEDAAAALRIRADYLRALEDGRPERLPGSAYALAFLRTYSKALGLDADDVVRRYKAESAALTCTPSLDFPQPAARGSVPLGAAVLVAAVLAIGAYAGWYRLSGEGRLPAEVVPPVPARLAEMAAPAKPATPPPVVATRPAAPSQQAAVTPPTIAPAAAPAAHAAVMPPAPPVRDVAAISISPTQAAAAVPPSPPVVSAPAPTKAEAAVPPPPGMRVEAIADAWVQVRDSDGDVVFSRLMHAGDSWPVPKQPGLILTTGNAGGTEIVDHGVSTGPLGAKGVVRHGIRLDPAQARAQAKAGAVAPVAAAQ